MWRHLTYKWLHIDGVRRCNQNRVVGVSLQPAVFERSPRDAGGMTREFTGVAHVRVHADLGDVLTVFIAEAIVQELAYDEFNA